MNRVARLGLSEPMIATARSGDSSAIARLLASAQPDIRRYARRNCRTASDIDDATQEALFVVYRRVDSLRAVAAFSAWLFRIVDRICFRLARQALHMPTPLDTIENDTRFSSRPDEELRLDLAAAIQSLPATYREVVLLRDIEELTIDEIAQRLGATRQAIKARLHRGRLLVREYIAR